MLKKMLDTSNENHLLNVNFPKMEYLQTYVFYDFVNTQFLNSFFRAATVKLSTYIILLDL